MFNNRCSLPDMSRRKSGNTLVQGEILDGFPRAWHSQDPTARYSVGGYSRVVPDPALVCLVSIS